MNGKAWYLLDDKKHEENALIFCSERTRSPLFRRCTVSLWINKPTALQSRGIFELLFVSLWIYKCWYKLPLANWMKDAIAIWGLQSCWCGWKCKRHVTTIVYKKMQICKNAKMKMTILLQGGKCNARSSVHCTAYQRQRQGQRGIKNKKSQRERQRQGQRKIQRMKTKRR